MSVENTNLQNSESQEYQKKRDNFIQNHLNPLNFKNIKFSKLEETANNYSLKNFFQFQRRFLFRFNNEIKKRHSNTKFLL